MTLYNNSYSGIITNGLGGPACCSILTVNFSLFFCQINVGPIPPANIGGGGPYPVNARSTVPVNWHTPRTNAWKYQPRQVNFIIKIAGKEIERKYVLSYGKTQAVVKIAEIVSSAKSKISTVLVKIRSSLRKVTVRVRDK